MTFRALIASALFVFVASATSLVAGDSAAPADWNLHCDKRLQGIEGCFLSQSVVSNDGNNIGGSIVIAQKWDAHQTSDEPKFVGRVVLPDGIPTTLPIALSTPEVDVARLSIATCDAKNGCIADFTFSDRLRKALSKSKFLQVTYHLDEWNAVGLPFEVGALQTRLEALTARNKQIKRYGLLLVQLEYFQPSPAGCAPAKKRLTIATEPVSGTPTKEEIQGWLQESVRLMASCADKVAQPNIDVVVEVTPALSDLWKNNPQTDAWQRADRAIAELTADMADIVKQQNALPVDEPHATPVAFTQATRPVAN